MNKPHFNNPHSVLKTRGAFTFTLTNKNTSLYFFFIINIQRGCGYTNSAVLIKNQLFKRNAILSQYRFKPIQKGTWNWRKSKE
ncbi:hypothetical protein EDB95_4983 [Dinghuibacter silviterrae]|uniref:Uncharacterized protein n=1 Tax=Dinghuibacter silviterrae TaxID=1539049 RepID=A0A4V3GKW0_9BACT|nr:hypothetical protein EDB95_4983 [Dinghuibacter silviterrae]